jgi:uncharacterized phage protein gp47/JayE
MSWPVPTAKVIAERFAGTLETAITRLKPLLDPTAISRAVRSSKGMFAQIGRAIALEARELHDHIAWWGRQYFPDTAEEELVLRHAAIWGVDQRAAIAATGTVLVEGTIGTALPSGIELSASDATRFITTATATIGSGGTTSVAAVAAIAGAAGNIEAGIRLVTITSYPDITRITVEDPGFAGGADEEDYKELQSAVLERIRQPPHGGAGFDYPTWVKDTFAAKAVAVVGDWIGRGSVGIIVAMKDVDGNPREATDLECAAILDHLGPPGTSLGVRPVTAHAVVVTAEMTAIPITVRLRPDTVATRAAVTEAFTRYVATIGDADDAQNASPIGAIIEPSRISEALSAASGEYAHDLVVPAARTVLDSRQYPIAGTITWAAAL